jgi:hypothetical protein
MECRSQALIWQASSKLPRPSCSLAQQIPVAEQIQSPWCAPCQHITGGTSFLLKVGFFFKLLLQLCHQVEEGPGAALNDDLLAVIFAALPTNCQILTVKSLNKHWQAWAVAKHSLPRVWTMDGFIPMWAIIEQCHRQKGGLTQLQVKYLCKTAMLYWDSDTVQWLLPVASSMRTVQQWLLPESSSMWKDALAEVAARHDNLDMLHWAQSNGLHFTADVCARVAQGGRLKVLQWTDAQEPPWSEDVSIRSLGRRHLEVLQWARAHDCPWNWRYLGVAAAQYGHAHVLKWIREQGYHPDEETEVIAALFLQVKALEWLKKPKRANEAVRQAAYLAALMNMRNAYWPSC